MAGFDPDAYLAEKKAPQGFDPDAYLKSKGTGTTPQAPVGTLKAGDNTVTDWVTDKLASVMPGIDSRAKYQRAQRMVGAIQSIVPGAAVPQALAEASAHNQAAQSAYGRGGLFGSSDGTPSYAGETAKAIGNLAVAGASALPVAGPLVRRGLPLAASALETGASALERGAAPTGERIAQTLGNVTTLPSTKAALQTVGALKGSVPQISGGEAWARALTAEQDKAALLKQLGVEQGVQAPGRIGIGQAGELSDVGQPVQKGIVENQAALEKARGDADAVLRGQQQAVVEENRAAGKKFSDTPTAKAIISQAKDIAFPDVTKAASDVKVTDPLTKSLYRRVYNALADKTTELTQAEATAAEKNGLQVDKTFDPKVGYRYYRTFNSSFEAADNLRRFLGQAFDKESGSYGAIADNIKKDIYSQLNQAQDEYVGGVHQKLQDAYTQASKRLEGFDTTLGKRITGTQGSSDVLKATPADLAKALQAGDRGKIDQLFSMTNPAQHGDLRQAFANALETKVAGKTSAEAANMLQTGTPLSDALAHPQLASMRPAVNNYISALERSEGAAKSAADIQMQLPKLDKVIAKADQDMTAAKVLGEQLDTIPPQQAADKVTAHLDTMHENGTLNDAQWRDLRGQAQQAGSTLNRNAGLKKVLKNAAILSAGVAGVQSVYHKASSLIP